MPMQVTFSYKEEKAIQELQMRMENCLTPAMCDDETLYYRFLKARDFDVDKAEKMLRKHTIWRKVNQVDTINEDFKSKECFCKYLEPTVVGFDKEGNIVVYCPAGKLDPVDALKCRTISDATKNWIWFLEKCLAKLKEENEKTGKSAFRSVAIIDLDKLPFAKVTCRQSADILLRIISIYQDNYPERLDSAYVINAPSYFVIFFSIIKQIMSGAMIRKIHIIGCSGWKEKLLEIIDADVLPAFLGGNRTDPDGDPMCRTFIKHGGRVPKIYFLSKQDRCFNDASFEVKNLTVQPSEKEEIRVEVNEVGSLLKWEFLVKGKDIRFGIFYEESEKVATEVIPIEKYGTADGTEMGSYKCRTTGEYTIVFDNSYSWISSKEVQYCITVEKPNL